MTDYTNASEDQLADGMRAAHTAAFQEFFHRFSPLLMHQAARFGVPADQRRTAVTELLDDVAERLSAHRLATRTSLAGYLCTALRRRVVNANRDRRNRERLEGEAASEIDGQGQAAIVALCSSHALRAIRTLDADDEASNAAVIALGALLLAALSGEERRLVAWLGERVPQREIAQWMGTTHGALRVRVSRLRRRLAAVSTGYEQSLDGADLTVVSRLLRRAGLPGSGGAEQTAEVSSHERSTPA